MAGRKVNFLMKVKCWWLSGGIRRIKEMKFKATVGKKIEMRTRLDIRVEMVVTRTDEATPQ